MNIMKNEDGREAAAALYLSRFRMVDGSLYYEDEEYLREVELNYLNPITNLFVKHEIDIERALVLFIIFGMAREVWNIRFHLVVTNELSKSVKKRRIEIDKLLRVLEKKGGEMEIVYPDGERIRFDVFYTNSIIQLGFEEYLDDLKEREETLSGLERHNERAKRGIQRICYKISDYLIDVLKMRPMKAYRLLAEYLWLFGYRFPDKYGQPIDEDQYFSNDSAKYAFLADRVKSLVTNYKRSSYKSRLNGLENN
jgi:hypothetical protein